ncbi:hypothetical protein [Maridesulfovibrio bastinii]|uniref:hypothetical protein n=1 Tax=Maridesulfovibrio bastinii TaxID=47157 RepID=UPI000483D4E5|nr:hypothetical protein [Maridesulfovibrio bastinii]
MSKKIKIMKMRASKQQVWRRRSSRMLTYENRQDGVSPTSSRSLEAAKAMEKNIKYACVAEEFSYPNIVI